MQRYSKQASAWEAFDRVVRTLKKREPVAPREVVAPARFRLDQRLDAEALAQMVADYEAGASANQLMERYAIGKGSVLRLLREAGVMLRNRRLSPADLDEAVQLYESGLSLKRVGEQLGISLDAVRGAFRRAGVQTRPRPEWNYES